MASGAVWLLLLCISLVGHLSLSSAYTISLLEQTITVDFCNVSVTELITIQPDALENITVFTREIPLSRGWRFAAAPSLTTSLGAGEASFQASNNDKLLTINIIVPPLSAFNVSISYIVTNAIDTTVDGPVNSNSLAWVITTPSVGVNVSGLRFAAIFLDQLTPVLARVGPSLQVNTTMSGNDTVLAYSQAELASRQTVSFAWEGKVVCVKKFAGRELHAGAVVGIVIGTLVGTVVLLIVLNLICGFFTPKPAPTPGR